jgi:Tfp pilus assembly major pilin PilA
MSTLKADTIVASDGSSPVTLTKQQAAKHWVNYDAVNQTTDGSFNQSTLTDNAEGDYTSTYTNGLSGASDKCIITCSFNTTNDGSSSNSGATRGGSNSDQSGGSPQSASSIKFNTFYGSNGSSNGALEDHNGSYCMTVGDLA